MVAADEYQRRVDGVREPDPTLGKNLPPRPPPAVEPVPPAPAPLTPAQPVKPPRRQRVVLADPRQGTTTLRARVELEEQTSWGELLIKDLVKAQLRTGLLLALLVVGVLGSLPVLFFFLPGFATASVIGVPVPWLLLGVVPFPLLFGAGLWYNRLAERHERDFVDMIES
ncbi:hypothetical protein GCM10009754_45090 [Amycolatopsis minnesotensis]|uniref:DUF485 domain-containing protein n=1 Tax=Amycolatopsis minnesotensis TaxID=337894 RepID=A0ABP5CRL5_9PSEU